MAAERDLLFGLIALQNGLIQQTGLVAAFHAWTCDKARPLADQLQGRGELDADDRAAVEALVARHLKRHEGDATKSLAAVPAGRSTRESLAKLGDAEIEATLGHVASGRASTEDGRADADRTASYAVGTATSDGQRFRVLRPHARGGLGAVFVALDCELHREVALKQILDQHADDPTSRARFLLEAEVTGGLEHPGIVPVYGLGTYADGRPYYAMRFVRGDSLKEAVDRFHADESLTSDPGRRSLELRRLLKRFQDVCDAIEYAHSRGVLHRDIKPGNIIVGKHGETLVVDWGLAKATGRSEPDAALGERTLVPNSASGSAETLPGSALGTPAYMSPEQAEGDLEHLGSRSDVYSLGATLYYVLTGRPPAEGDIHDVIRAVQRGEFPPPRRHDPTIDPALEAVCLRAMARRPEDRYATPRALSEDVERWMADEPVSAWREPRTRTLLRWLSRHRVGVTALGAAVLVALAGTATVLAVQTRANAALTSANAELGEANRKVNRANADLAASVAREQSRFALAQEAIRMFHTGVSADVLLKQEEFKALRTRLLRGARDFYRKLEGLLQGQTDRESRLALARAYGEVGRISADIDSMEGALEVQRRAAELFDGLARESPDGEARAGQAQCLESLVGTLASTGRMAESIAATGRVRDLYRALAEATPADRRRRGDWARAESLYGDTIWLEQHRTDEGKEAIGRARAILEELVAAEPSEPRFRRDLATTYGLLASRLRDDGRHEEAMPEWGRAVGQLEALFRASPGDPTVGHELARNLGNMALGLADAGRRAEALKVEDRAREVLEAVGRANPTLRLVTADRAWLDLSSGINLAELGRDDEALAAMERAREAREALARSNPTVPRYPTQLALIHRRMAWIHRRAGRMAEARVSYDRAGHFARTAATFLEEREAQGMAAETYRDLADFLDATGRPSEALAWRDEATALAGRDVAADPSSARSRAALADALRRRAVTCRKLGRAAEAAADLRRAIDRLQGLTSPSAGDLYGLACTFSLLSGVAAGPSADGGRDPVDEAMAALRRAVAAGYRDASWMRGDTDLDPIRPRPDFQSLLLDLAMPADPFGRND